MPKYNVISTAHANDMFHFGVESMTLRRRLSLERGRDALEREYTKFLEDEQNKMYGMTTPLRQTSGYVVVFSVVTFHSTHTHTA